MSTFIIIQEGRAFAPVTIRSDELLIGSAIECGLQLNHPSVPMALAGIKHLKDGFYFLPVKTSPFSDAQTIPILFNGYELAGDVALADNDTITAAGFRLQVKKDGDALVIRVSRSEQAAPLVSKAGKTLSATRAGSEAGRDLLATWIKRRLWKGRRKLANSSSLQPSPQKRQPGTEFNWSPTWDLMPPWPVRFLALCLLTVVAAALLVFFVWPSIFAPGSISRAHSLSSSILSPPIASNPNSGSCLTCHTLKGTVFQNCAQCHQAAGFQADITDAHKASGLTCVSCHAEHDGENFSPKAQAFKSCAGCHNDENKETYNGKSVHRPHGGTFGYPATAGRWVWPGLSQEALKLKPEIEATQSAAYDEQVSRRVQFHALHLYRVKVIGGLTGIEEGVLSCSSCHKKFAGKFDRDTPRQTCPVCHNGYISETSKRVFVDAGKPNCTSCHVEHLDDAYRWGDLLTEPAYEKRQRAIDKRYLDAVKRSALLQ